MNILRRADVAAKIGIHPITLDVWVKRGDFPTPFRISTNRPVWDEEDVNAWLETKKSPGEPNGIEGTTEVEGVCTT